jgi:hypothetical protein
MLSRNVDTCCLVICNLCVNIFNYITCVEIRFCCKLQEFRCSCNSTFTYVTLLCTCGFSRVLRHSNSNNKLFQQIWLFLGHPVVVVHAGFEISRILVSSVIVPREIDQSFVTKHVSHHSYWLLQYNTLDIKFLVEYTLIHLLHPIIIYNRNICDLFLSIIHIQLTGKNICWNWLNWVCTSFWSVQH